MNIQRTMKRLIPAVLLTLCLMAPLNGQEQKLSVLLERSPAPVNAMGYVNVKSLQKLMKDAQHDGKLSDSVEEYWFVADLNIGELKPRWEAGYAIMSVDVTADGLAQQVNGYTDELSGKTVVWSPDQTYLYPIESNRLGVLRPTNRSLLAKWVDGDRILNDSEYLEARTKPPEEFLSVMLSVDLGGYFSPVPMAAKLEGVESLKSIPAKTAASVLASVRGFSVLIGNRGLNDCMVQIDFDKSPAGLKLVAADVLAEILERGGSAAPEVRTWKVATKDNTLSFRGPISQATLTGLLSIFSLQDAASRQAGGSPRLTDSSEEDQIKYRTKAYFDDVVAVIERTRAHKSQTTGALAKWNDSRARKIDQLGTLKVDPAMLQYGSDVAELLRGNALTVREGNIATGMTKAGQSLSSNYGNGYGYGYDYNSSVDYQRVAGAYNRGNAYTDYKQTLSEIDKRTAAVRRSMTEKYEMQF